MKIPAIFIAVFIIIVGALSTRLNRKDTGSSTLSYEVSNESSVTFSPTPTSVPTATATPTPVRKQDSSGVISPSLSDFLYPGAKILTISQTSASLESSEDPDKITDWYKDKIVGLGMNVKSFVNTKANDRVLNKLAGANATRQINVEISKDSGTSLVKISVSLENF